MECQEKQCCCAKTKMRSEQEVKLLMNRLNRIEGQVRGIKKMVENSAYCPDILLHHRTCYQASCECSKTYAAG